MTPELASLCVLAALLELDTTHAFQFTFARGIVAGPLLSLLTGDWATGIQAGIFTELLFADISPLGTILPPSAVVCCAVTVALHALGIEVCFAFVWGVVCATLFARAERYMRKRRVRLLPLWEQRIVKNPNTINRVILFELAASFVMNLTLITAFVWLTAEMMLWLTPHIPVRAVYACRFAYMAVPWIGLVSLIPEFRLKKR